eukprot:8068261-Karenia_brevis.AAC.1
MMRGEAAGQEKTKGDKESKGDRVIDIETKSKVPRSFKISKDHTAKHRGTPGCPGCSAVRRNMAFQPHNLECKK